MSETLTFEYLGTPRAERRRPPLLAIAALVILVAVVGGFLWWAESVKSRTTDELAAVFAESIARADSGEKQVQGTLAYASPLIWSADVPADVRAGLRAVVEDSAADVSDDFVALRARLEGAMVLPWHEDQALAKEELLALLQAQQGRFDGIAADASDIDLVLAGGPLQTGVVVDALRQAGAR